MKHDVPEIPVNSSEVTWKGLESVRTSANTPWNTIAGRLFESRRAGKLCLLPMILNGYPSRQDCLRYSELLVSLGVEFVEIVNPIAGGWAATTNEEIRAAHIAALNQFDSSDGPLLAQKFAASLKVIYQGNVKSTLTDLIREEATRYSIFQLAIPPGLLLDVKNERHLPPMTTQISVSDELSQIVDAVKAANSMIVCKVAPRTGGALVAWERISEVLRLVRRISDLPVFCTFGVSTPDAIRKLREQMLCDGAIVGTAILLQLAQGLSPTEAFVRKLQRAATE